MIAIDQYAYTSKLAQVDPKAKIAFSMIPLLICLFFGSYAVSLCTLCVMSFGITHNSRMTLKRYLLFLMIPLGFLLMGIVPILVSPHPLDADLLVGVHIGSQLYGVSSASLQTGTRLIARALAAVSCMYFLSFNTPMNSLFEVLEASRLPAVIVSLMELIYRYIFVIWEEADRIRTAQHSRLGYGSFRSSLACVGVLASGLFLRAYQRCDRTYAALESRGYDGSLSTIQEEQTPCPKLYRAAALFSAFLLLVGILEQTILKGW